MLAHGLSVKKHLLRIVGKPILHDVFLKIFGFCYRINLNLEKDCVTVSAHQYALLKN